MTLKFYDNDTLVIGGGDWELAPFKFSKILRIGGGVSPTWRDVILHGTMSLTLVNAKADSLTYLKLFGDTEQLPETYIDSVTLDGKCEQNGTPTPTVPLQINCNNGTISWDSVNQEIIVTGTTETVTDSNGLTATAQMLLSVGDYKDTQEVLSGAVTRNVGIVVLDGTENWNTSVTSKFYLDNDYMRNYNNMPLFCTHYKSVLAGSTSGVGFGEIGLFATASPGISPARLVIGDDNYTSVNDFKAYLSQQYQAGTPVIVVYPAISATTETVTPQVLNKEPVTVTGSLTGLVANVVSSSHTTPTPTQPLPINCNNGVLGIDSQGNITVTGTTETVEVTGKNLCVPQIGTADGLTRELTLDGRIHISGTCTRTTSGFRICTYVLPAGTYTLQCTVTGNAGSITTVTFNSFASIPLGGTRTMTKSTDVNSSASIPITLGTAYDFYISPMIELGSTATTYEPYYYGGSATAERLLKVGTYQDVQSVLDGEVTRNIGIKVLDGTENDYAKRSDYAINYTGLTDRAYGTKIYGMCSHFVCSANNTSTAPVGSLFFNTSNNFLHFFTEYGGDVTSFKAWIASQYNSGFPVILVYPLATPTTETVTPQPLTIQAGTNVVEITQASMNNLELEVSYKAGVSVTVTEIENAQLDNSVEVTVNG